MTLLDRIRILCAQKGISIAKLERTLGFGNGSIGRWDKSSPSIDKLQTVADYFGLPMDLLLARDEQYSMYFRLAQGAKELELDDDDIDAILNLYQKHRERNR